MCLCSEVPGPDGNVQDTQHSSQECSGYSHACFCLSSVRLSKCLCVCVVKYLGLMAMSKILKTHPKSVQAHKDLILQCLDDKDESIRLRALDLLYGMVSSNTPPVSQ